MRNRGRVALRNAIRHAPPETSVEVKLARNNGRAVVDIRDHGAGLPTEKLDRVFDKYARLQKRDSQVAGTGLGLAICKAMMEAQGSSITAANHPEGGAVFTVELPIAPSPGR